MWGGAGRARPTTALEPGAGRRIRDAPATGGREPLRGNPYQKPTPQTNKNNQGGAPGTWGVTVPGRLPLTAFALWGVRRRRREAWETVPKLLETCLQFRFRNFRDLWVSIVGWDSGKGEEGARGWPCGYRSPFGAVVGLLTHPGVPGFASLGSVGSLEGLGLPAPRADPAPETSAPVLQFVGSSCAASADPSPLVGNHFRRGDTLSESGSIAAALHGLLPLHPCTVTEGPGGPIGLLTPSKWIQVSPGRSKRENRLPFGAFPGETGGGGGA